MSYMVTVSMVLEIGVKDIALTLTMFYLIHMQNWLKDDEFLVMSPLRCLIFWEHMILIACLLTGGRITSFQIYMRLVK